MASTTTTFARRAIAALAAALIALAAFTGIAGTAQAATCNHTYGDWTVDTLATDSAKGTAHRTCSKCGNVDTTKTTMSSSGVQRIAGSTRYATSSSIADLSSHPNTVIVTTGTNFPDALCATSLAGIYNCPILLTKGSELSAETAAYLNEKDDVTVYIIGGYNAVSQKVEDQINDETKAEVIGRIFGNTRYGTALEIYNYGIPMWDNTAIITTGGNYPDALSISSFAYSHYYPIFLSNPKTGLDDDTKEALESGDFANVIIVGGENAVSEETEQWINENVTENVTRLKGDNRYETSEAIAEYAVNNGYLDVDAVCIATGKNFPDALAGGAFAGSHDSIMLLADSSNDQTLSVLEDNADYVNGAYILGGTNAVPLSIDEEVQKIIGITLPASIDFTDAKINYDKLGYEYTGEAVEPDIEVTIADGKYTLTEGVDYTVTFENNVELGMATATFTGIGSFTGTQTVSFPIHKPYVATGTCGRNLSYGLDEDGLLMICGTGTTWDPISGYYTWSPYKSQIKAIQVGEGVTYLKSKSFNDCKNLTSVSLPSTLTQLGNSAFSGCSNLATVTIADTSKLQTIGDKAFYECTSLQAFEIPSTVTSIGTSAFYSCKNLESAITIPAGMTSISDTAFFNCAKIPSVTFAEGSLCTSIGTLAFGSCSNLSSVTFSSDSQVETIGDSAFDSCTSLTSFMAPSSVTSIERRAFNLCTNLTSASVPADAEIASDAFPSTCTITRY